MFDVVIREGHCVHVFTDARAFLAFLQERHPSKRIYRADMDLDTAEQYADRILYYDSGRRLLSDDWIVEDSGALEEFLLSLSPEEARNVKIEFVEPLSPENARNTEVAE